MSDYWQLSVIKPRSKGPLRTTEYLIKTKARGPVASLVTFGDLPEDERNVAQLIKSAPNLLHALAEIGRIASRPRSSLQALVDDMEKVRTTAIFAVRGATKRDI